MNRLFLSHKYEEKKNVEKIQNYLTDHFIQTWLDKSDLPNVEGLREGIQEGINKCDYFVAFISKNYINSGPCAKELKQALNLQYKDKINIIPVMLDERNALLKEAETKSPDIKTLLDDAYCLELDSYNTEHTAKTIADIVSKNEGFGFDPIVQKEIDGVKFQDIQCRVDNRKFEKFLPDNFLETWKFDWGPFMASDYDDEKPIKKGLPVAISGKLPNWMISYLTIPLRNQRTVYVYNQHTGYICVYNLERDKENFPGRILRD